MNRRNFLLTAGVTPAAAAMIASPKQSIPDGTDHFWVPRARASLQGFETVEITDNLSTDASGNRLRTILTGFSEAYGERVDRYFRNIHIIASWARHGDVGESFEDSHHTWMLRLVEHKVPMRYVEGPLPRSTAASCVWGMKEIVNRAAQHHRAVIFGDLPLPLPGLGVAAQNVLRASGIVFQTLLTYDPAHLTNHLHFVHVIGIPGEPYREDLLMDGHMIPTPSNRVRSRLVPYYRRPFASI